MRPNKRALIPKSCRLFGQDHAAEQESTDPEKL
jgi:hypothetical protein